MSTAPLTREQQLRDVLALVIRITESYLREVGPSALKRAQTILQQTEET